MNLPCPICRTPTSRATHADFPFCSERCRLRDLGNWAMEKYVVSEPASNPDAGESSDTISPAPDESDE